MYEVRWFSIVETSTGAGGKAEGASCTELCVDTEPPGGPDWLWTIDPAVASSVERGELSGFAIRSPPRDWERLRSPFMTRVCFFFISDRRGEGGMSELDDLGSKERDYDGERKHCGCMVQ